MEKKENPLHCWWECKLIQPLWRTVWRFLKKLKIELPYDPGIPLLGIYPKKTIIQKDTCTPMFTAALFTIARSWKQPKCPSTDEQIKKMWYIYKMEYYSAIKRNDIGSFVVRWMDLETVIQSGVTQKEKNKYRILTHIFGLRKMVQMNWFAGQNLRRRFREETYGHKAGKAAGGGGGGGMNWEIGIDMYTLMCIKLMTNKNLLYKKINKIKFKKKKMR